MMEALMLLYILVTTVSALGCDSSQNCVNLTCHLEQATPKCTHGCVAGYAGNLCKEYCFHKCVACERNDPERCTNCDKGLFGNRCESQCPNCRNSSCHINGSCVEGCKSSWWGPACTESCPGECQEECDLHSGACIRDTTVTFRTSSQVEQASTSTQKKNLTVILSVTVTLVVLAMFAGMILYIFRNGCPQRQMNKQDIEVFPLEKFQNVYERLNDDSLTATASTNESYDRLQLGDSVTASDEQTTTGCPSPMNKKPETDCKLGTERPKTPVSTPDPLPMSSSRTDSEQDMWRESQDQDKSSTKNQPDTSNYPHSTSDARKTLNKVSLENNDDEKDIIGTKDPPDKFKSSHTKQTSETRKNRELEKVHQGNALNDSEHRNVTSDVNGIPVKVATGNERIETVNAEKSVYASEEFCSNGTSEFEEMSDHHATENENKENQCSSTKPQTHPSPILAHTRVPSEIKQTSVKLAACTDDGENEVNPVTPVRLSRQPDATSQIKQNEDDHVASTVDGDKENNTPLSIPTDVPDGVPQ